MRAGEASTNRLARQARRAAAAGRNRHAEEGEGWFAAAGAAVCGRRGILHRGEAAVCLKLGIKVQPCAKARVRWDWAIARRAAIGKP